MTRHPAQYSRELYPVLRRELEGRRRVLDPFAGMGNFLDLLDEDAVGVGVEIEAEWAANRPEVICGDSHRLHPMFGPDAFDAIVSSPVYPNGMADNFDAKDGSRRHTYRQALGRPLTAGSMAGVGRGLTRRHNDGHKAIAQQCVMVLAPGGKLVWNVKDVIKGGKVVHVVEWWANLWEELGLDYQGIHRVPCPGMRHGANGQARVDTEAVLVFAKLW